MPCIAGQHKIYSRLVEKKRKVYGVRHHYGSLCLERQTGEGEWAREAMPATPPCVTKLGIHGGMRLCGGLTKLVTGSET